MNKTRLVWLAVTIFGFGIAASMANFEALTASIPFPFKAGGKDLPAGTYLIQAPMSGELVIRNEDTGETAFAPYLSRLSAKDVVKAEIVFDKTEDQYYLSEIHLPGIDGFELVGAPGKHTHVRVTVGKK